MCSVKKFLILHLLCILQVDFIVDEFHENCLEAMLPYRFSFFGDGGYSKVGNEEGDISQLNPTLKLHTDRDVYRPGDSIYFTIEICNPLIGDKTSSTVPSLLVERLGFEIKGIEKLDTQWFAIQKPSIGMKHRRGWIKIVFIAHLFRVYINKLNSKFFCFILFL